MQWSPRSATDFLVIDDSGTNLYRCKITPSVKEDTPSNALAYDLLGFHPGNASCASFCPVRPCIAIGRSTDGVVEIVLESDFGSTKEKINRLENTNTTNPHHTACTALAWVPDSDVRLAAAYYNPNSPCKILLWDALTVSSSRTVNKSYTELDLDDATFAASLLCVPESKNTIVSGMDGPTPSLYVYDQRSGSKIAQKFHTDAIYGLCADPHTPTLLASFAPGKGVTFWDLRRLGTQLGTLPNVSGVRNIAWSNSRPHMLSVIASDGKGKDFESEALFYQCNAEYDTIKSNAVAAAVVEAAASIKTLEKMNSFTPISCFRCGEPSQVTGVCWHPTQDNLFLVSYASQRTNVSFKKEKDRRSVSSASLEQSFYEHLPDVMAGATIPAAASIISPIIVPASLDLPNRGDDEKEESDAIEEFEKRFGCALAKNFVIDKSVQKMQFDPVCSQFISNVSFHPSGQLSFSSNRMICTRFPSAKEELEDISHLIKQRALDGYGLNVETNCALFAESNAELHSLWSTIKVAGKIGMSLIVESESANKRAIDESGQTSSGSQSSSASPPGTNPIPVPDGTVTSINGSVQSSMRSSVSSSSKPSSPMSNSVPSNRSNMFVRSSSSTHQREKLFVGCLRLLQDSSDAEVPPTSNASTAFKGLYTTKQRGQCKQLCGWRWGSNDADKSEDFRNLMVTLEEHGEYERAAAIAVFSMQWATASRVLRDAAAKLSATAHTDDEKERVSLFRMTSVLVSGFHSTIATGSQLDLTELRKSCEPVMAIAQEKAPYFYAFMKFILSSDLKDMESILRDSKGMVLSDRLAFGCSWVGLRELLQFVQEEVRRAVSQGDISGIMLCGLNNPKNVTNLLQHYVDRTGDVQTASFLSLLPEVKISRLSPQDAWIRSYRELLNSWQLWEIRAKLDIAIEPLWDLEEATKLFPRYDSSKGMKFDGPQHQTSVPNCCVCLLPLNYLPGSSTGYHSSTSAASSAIPGDQHRHSLMQPQQIQQSASGRMPRVSPAAAVATAEQERLLTRKIDGERHARPGAPQPSTDSPIRRSASGLVAREPAAAAAKTAASGTASASASSAASVVSSSSSDAAKNLPGSDFAQWWSWCQSCKHVAHTTHIREWFAHNDECPVTDCHCHCYSKDKI